MDITNVPQYNDIFKKEIKTNNFVLGQKISLKTNNDLEWFEQILFSNNFYA